MRITTFAATKDDITTALSSGAHHLILEDPKLSIRCYAPNTSPDFNTLCQLADHARHIQPNIELSVNCDILAHERHLPLLETFLETLPKAGLSTIRIQDPGLHPLIKSRLPKATLHLATETGNQNLESIQYYANLFARQTLSNELPSSEIKKIKSPTEIQVQGPILIQYSTRRFMAGHYNTESASRKLAQAHEYPGRSFIFYDNPHGHFMYLYFDKCLLKSIPDLRALNLESWLIDARGESQDYLQNSIQYYKTAYENPDTWQATQAIEMLESLSGRPQKPGFFKVNKTDQQRRKLTLPENDIHVGTVIDTINGKNITLEVHHPFTVKTQLDIISPEGKTRPTNITTLQTLWGDDLNEAIPGTLVQLNWQKGAQVKSKLITQKSS